MEKENLMNFKKDELIEKIIDLQKQIKRDKELLDAMETKIESIDKDNLSLRKQYADFKEKNSIEEKESFKELKNYKKENEELRIILKQYEQRNKLLSDAITLYSDAYNQSKYVNNAMLKSMQGTADLASELYVISEQKVNKALENLNKRGDE